MTGQVDQLENYCSNNEFHMMVTFSELIPMDPTLYQTTPFKKPPLGDNT